MSYGLIDYLSMFGGSFFVVLLLGIQSRNVQKSHYFAAIVTSLGISVSNFLFVKYAAAGNYVAFSVMAVAGCMGIASSIWLSDNYIHKKRKSL